LGVLAAELRKKNKNPSVSTCKLSVNFIRGPFVLQKPEIPSNEAERLQALRSYAILDSQDEEVFDELTRLAARILDVPITLVTLVDESRQWFKSRHGLEARETSREISFCGHVVANDAMMLVPDAFEDERFHDNPFVSGGPLIRFYIGMPLRTAEGLVLGTLCAIDHVPRVLTEEQKDLLRILANQVMTQLELRKHARRLERKRALIAAKDEELRAMFAGMVEGVVLQAADGTTVACNPAACSILGLTEDQLMGRSSLDEEWRTIREDGSEFRGEDHPAMAALRTSEPQSNVVMGVHKVGDEFAWIQIHSEPILKDGQAVSVVTTFRDITAEREMMRELADHLDIERELSRTDSLTKIRNRRAFGELAEYIFASAERSNSPLTLAYLDLDDFKALNDEFGHATGDEALKLVANILQTHTRKTDVTARLGGDEFGLLLPETDLDAATLLIERVVEELGRAMKIREWPTTVSVGAVVFRSRPASLDQAIEQADAAMYQAKRAGKAQMKLEVFA